MDAGSENPRGVHAIMVLTTRRASRSRGCIDAAFDSYLPSFDDAAPAAADAATSTAGVGSR